MTTIDKQMLKVISEKLDIVIEAVKKITITIEFKNRKVKNVKLL